MSVEPRLVCPGDEVSITWDLNLPRALENCEYQNGGYDEPIPCVASSDCPSAGVCTDAYCCVSSEHTDECGSPAHRCTPDFEVTITGDPTPLEPPVNDAAIERGSRVIRPEEPTMISLEGGFDPPETTFDADPFYVRVVREPGSNTFTIPFNYVCGAGWSQYDFNTSGPSASEHVTIVGVRNVNRFPIDLSVSGLTEEPVHLRPDEITTNFNGPLKGQWDASINVADLIRLPIPVCDTHPSNLYPDLQVELLLQCSVTP